jgi:hypothetical protein
MLARQRERLAGMSFKPEEWTCSQAELEQIDRKNGEEFARNQIEQARQHYTSKRKQAEELRWSCQIACSFTASCIYSLPILIAAIRELEQ